MQGFRAGFRFEVEDEGASGPATHLVDPGIFPCVRKVHFRTEAGTLEAFRTLIAVAGPAWKHAVLDFFWDSKHVSAWVNEVYSLLRSCPSLSTIRLRCCGGRYLPTLVCGNPSLETLALDCTDSLNCLEDAGTLALCFSENSVLKSFTLATRTRNPNREVMLKPFTEGWANAAVKGLVLITGCRIFSRSLGEWISNSDVIQATANLVRANTSLEKLKLSFDAPNMQAAFSLIPKALAFNRTLKEFHWDCATVAGLKELRAAFTPGSSGNSHVTTLKLCPFHKLELGEFMKELSELLERNTSLKHVEVVLARFSQVSKPWIHWEVRSSNAPPPGATECTQDMVESMVAIELRVNTSLESVVVGSWRLLRVDGHGEWQMKYCGPCLLRRSPRAQESWSHFTHHAQLFYVVSHYDVEVQIRQ